MGFGDQYELWVKVNVKELVPDGERIKNDHCPERDPSDRSSRANRRSTFLIEQGLGR